MTLAEEFRSRNFSELMESIGPLGNADKADSSDQASTASGESIRILGIQRASKDTGQTSLINQGCMGGLSTCMATG